jgi:MarR family transcriptional regulator, negative regulator of the multidrug operon emrRAB
MQATNLAERIETGISRVQALHPAMPVEAARLVRLTDFVSRLMFGRLERFFSRHALTDTSWLFLMSLYTAPEGVRSPSEVGQVLGQSKPHMTRLSDGLLVKGLIRRANNEDDRRRVVLALTAKGRRTVERLLPQVWIQHRQLAAGLSDADLRQLAALLAKWLGQLDGSAAGDEPVRRNGRRHARAAA